MKQFRKYNFAKYIYLVITNNGFYLEPDYEIKKIFLSYQTAKKYLNKIKNYNKDVFIMKKALYFE